MHAEQECAALVKSKYPDATGATLTAGSICLTGHGDTVAIFGANNRYCVFPPGNIILHIKISHVLWKYIGIHLNICTNYPLFRTTYSQVW